MTTHPLAHEVVAAHAARAPAAPAVEDDQTIFSYGELHARSDALARALVAAGVEPEDVVGLRADRTAGGLVALLAIWKTGAAYLPLDPEAPPARLEAIVADAKPRLVLATRAPPTLWGAPALDPDALAATASSLPRVRPDHAAYVLYTSGSTGAPKGVVVEHHALAHRVHALSGFAVRPGDRVSQYTSWGWDASLFELFLALGAGATLRLIPPGIRRSGPALTRFLEEKRIDIAFFPPSVLAAMPPAPLPRLRAVMVGGDVFPRSLVETWGGARRFLNLYGPTETTVWMTTEECVPGREATLGRPIPGVHVRIVDDALARAPPGEAGEICIGGEGLARGYLDRPDATRERFVPDPEDPRARLYRTGDRGRILPDGRVEFLGRLDRQVKVRGVRIELGEVEAALAVLPGVCEAAVVADDDPRGGRRLVAYVVSREAPDAPRLAPDDAARATRDALAGTLVDAMVPSVFVEMPALPRLPNDKLDRRALPSPEALRAPGGEPVREPPRTPLEGLVAQAWAQELGLPHVGRHDNVFALGAHSLLATHVQARLERALGRPVDVVLLFEHPTVAALAERLARDDTPAPKPATGDAEARAGGGKDAVAIVGMACRFPGADSPGQFFDNLLRGVESVMPRSEWDKPEPRAVPARERPPGPALGLVHGIDRLDAAYFGLSPREAELMDPQQRLFLECAAEALQRAGHDGDGGGRRVGVYAGMGINTYFARHVLPNPRAMEGPLAFQAVASNEKDFLATQASYRLDLQGPSVSVHTACSTSLVAVAMAFDALRAGQCDVALAGGSSVKPDPSFGFFLEEGGIASPDGVCRAFDAAANGTVGGSGVGVVVLKRLADALADGDAIHAVIRGAAVNNDGGAKAGYAAPSVEGQAAVVAAAQAVAGVTPDTVGYVEAHGTGTPVGDPIEVAALTRVFRTTTEERGYCALGAVKTNIGHLDAAAGVAGLIKAALALERGVVPPTLHFRRPNPALRLEESPFFVNAEPTPLAPRGGAPRRAGVSSFGIGGTNAHVVLEEAPPRAERPPADARPQVLVLSARTPTALDAAAQRLAAHLEAGGEPLADAAWTLQTGRRSLPHRRAVVAASAEEAVEALRGGAPRRVLQQASDARERDVAFLLPGQGAQHVGMARRLYETEPAFRAELDRCADLFARHLGHDLREILFPPEGREQDAAARLEETEVTQPALFAVEHALARLWMAWGVRPSALLGHSLGEYVAACLAGVMALEDAVALVALRSRLMQRLPEGAMLAVRRSAADVEPLLGDGLAIAAVNDPAACVVSGEPRAMAALARRLAAEGVETRPLRVRRAFHSPMMEPILAEFEAHAREVKLRPPEIPYLSNLTGDWIRPEEATDPAYWARHLRGTVRFADGLARLMEREDLALLEVGPGRTLSALAAARARARHAPVLASLPPAGDARADDALALREAAARLWLAGARLDWRGVHAPHRPRRARLPAYPWERQRYWLPALAATHARAPATAAPREEEPMRRVPVEEVRPSHQRPALPTPYAAPTTPLEAALVEAWEDLFGFQGVGVHDDFFDLGGHSLLATRLVARLRETFGVELELPRLFEVRTVAQLAPVVEALLLERLESMSEDEVEKALRS